MPIPEYLSAEISLDLCFTSEDTDVKADSSLEPGEIVDQTHKEIVDSSPEEKADHRHGEITGCSSEEIADCSHGDGSIPDSLLLPGKQQLTSTPSRIPEEPLQPSVEFTIQDGCYSSHIKHKDSSQIGRYCSR